jgi:DNA (cytosine-5)-methyltransferase 1
MRVSSFFAGIGGFDLGLERAGMNVVFQCELDPFCQQILKRHWPHVPLHDDITTLNPTTIPAADRAYHFFTDSRELSGDTSAQSEN